MRNIIIISGIVAAFIGGFFLIQKYNVKIEPKNTEKPLIVTVTQTEKKSTEKNIQIILEKPENLKEIIGELLVEKYGSSAQGQEIIINKKSENFATGGMVGGMWLAAKMNGEWQLAYDGNGVADCYSLKTVYSFPEDYLTGVCE